MAIGLPPGKLGYKINDVLIGLQSGTTDTPESIASTQNKLHTLGYAWNPDTLSYEVITSGGDGVGLDVNVTNAAPRGSVRMVEASATLSYFGFAAAGAAESSAVWQMFSLDVSTGLVLKYADGNTNFDNVWSDYLTLTYT